MSLIKCSECGGNVSESAESCPHCGDAYFRLSADDKKFRNKAKEFERNALGCIFPTLMILGLLLMPFIFARLSGG